MERLREQGSANGADVRRVAQEHKRETEHWEQEVESDTTRHGIQLQKKKKKKSTSTNQKPQNHDNKLHLRPTYQLLLMVIKKCLHGFIAF